MKTVGLAVAGLVILAGSDIGLYRHAVLLADEPAGVTAPITSVSSDALGGTSPAMSSTFLVTATSTIQLKDLKRRTK